MVRVGRQPDRCRPPPSCPRHTFCLLVWDACHVVGTTVIAQYIWVDGGGTTPPSSFMVESWWRSWGLAPSKLQRICILRYLNLVLILPNNTWMVTHFFMCIAVQSHRKISQVQNFQFSSFLAQKMCMFYSSSWIIFLKFKIKASNLIVADQCQDRPFMLQHLSDFSKIFLFIMISWAQRNLGC